MAGLKSLAKDTAIYGLSSIVGRFLNYLLVPLYTNVISAESFEKIDSYREKVFRGEDYVEGIRSFLDKRAPQYKGRAKDLDTGAHEAENL